jgi:hypothetical protein
MSAVAGSALLVYQGASERRSCKSAGSWPAVAYQVTAAAWQAIWNGTVRSAARAVRLRGLSGAEDLLRVLDRDFSQPPLMPIKEKTSLLHRARPGRY